MGLRFQTLALGATNGGCYVISSERPRREHTSHIHLGRRSHVYISRFVCAIWVFCRWVSSGGICVSGQGAPSEGCWASQPGGLQETCRKQCSRILIARVRPEMVLSETLLWCSTWPQSQDQQRSAESPEERPHVHAPLSFWVELMRVTVRAETRRASSLASVVGCHDS